MTNITEDDPLNVETGGMEEGLHLIFALEDGTGAECRKCNRSGTHADRKPSWVVSDVDIRTDTTEHENGMDFCFSICYSKKSNGFWWIEASIFGKQRPLSDRRSEKILPETQLSTCVSERLIYDFSHPAAERDAFVNSVCLLLTMLTNCHLPWLLAPCTACFR